MDRLLVGFLPSYFKTQNYDLFGKSASSRKEINLTWLYINACEFMNSGVDYYFEYCEFDLKLKFYY